jgi:carboxypeptidase C (cathepsin A)
MRFCHFLRAFVLFVCLPIVAVAQDSTAKVDEPNRNGDKSAQSREQPAEESAGAGRRSRNGVLALLPPDSVTEHVLEIDSRKLAYQATAGTLKLFAQEGEQSAAIFYTSYVVKGEPGDRPLTFVFNGGPGAASAFLHLGLVGPKILDFGPTERDGANAKLIDNPQSWLDFTDLVLIDPIGTGWSRTAKAEDAQKFYGVKQDAQAIAKTIALYLSHTGRVSSPKYLLGESYGGLRAVKVARALQQDQGVIASGIVMLSPLLEAPLQFGASRFALGAALQLPSLAAAELERRNAFSIKEIQAAEHFALNDFLTTLAGPPLEGATADSFYARVAQLTGLPIEVVRKTRGFVRDAFVKHLRQRESAVVSPYDVTFAASDPYPESDSARGDDPILDGFVRAYGGAFASYARDQLGFKTEMTYALLADGVNGKWDWGNGHGSRAQVSASDDIRELLTLNPSFRVMVAHGCSDLITPYAVNKYVIDHLPEKIGNRVTLKIYRGGHMLYTKPSSRIEFTTDANTFYGVRAFEASPKN